MMSILYQDKEIILFHPYTWNGKPDGIYLKQDHFSWSKSTIGTDYKLLLDKTDCSVIQISNEYYNDKYAAIEPSLIGDVLILGAGLQTLSTYLSTGTSWKWVERNPYLAALVPSVGTMHEGDAEDQNFVDSLGTFDTILIDFKRTKLVDYDSLLNPGGSIIEMRI